MFKRFTQAYRQAPWRTQLQAVGLFLLVLVGVVLIAGLYLTVSAQAADAGMSVYSLAAEKEDLDREIANQYTQLAILTSARVMEKRAKDLGFSPANPESAVFVAVPGFNGRQPVFLAPPPGPKVDENLLVKPIYRQSLWEWLYQGIFGLTGSNQ